MNILTHTDARNTLLALEQPERASAAARFFQAHPDGYGAGDQFLELSMPQQHTVAKRYVRLLLDEVEHLLRDPYHECRRTALMIWVYQARSSKTAGRKPILERYVANRRYVNNWDLVDSSETALIGETRLNGDRPLLYKLADEAVALVASLAFIRKGQFADTFALIE